MRDDRAAPVGEAGTAEVTPDAQSDRRFAERKQSRTSAVIVNPNGDRVKCTVQDISSSGARIALPVDASSMSRAGDYVAPRFRLTMPIENVSFEAEIAWRSGNRLGARFVSPAQIEQPKLRRKVAAQPEKPDLKSIATALFRR